MVRYDVIVVGGGPVGLHAALKCAVLNQSVLLVDRGPETSRAYQAPAIANLPGMPGVGGPDLLRRLRRDLDSFAKLSGHDLVEVAERTEATDAAREPDGYRVSLRETQSGHEHEAHGRTLLLATGVIDRRPDLRMQWGGMPYLRRGSVGYCILCEGWSLTDKRVAVLGTGHDAAQIATDLADHFGADPTLIDLEDPTAPEATPPTVPTETREVASIHDQDGKVVIEFTNGTKDTYDKAMLACGFHKVNNELAQRLGAKTTNEGHVVTNEDCEALDENDQCIPGLFAIGDLRENRWKQIVVGWGEAERAAITAYAYRLP